MPKTSKPKTSTPETLNTDICIVGAGPAGGTLACLLAQAGIRTAVVDRAALPPMEHPDFDGRAYAIAAGSRAILQAAGLWDRLPFPPGAISDIRVSDGRLGRPASRLYLHFNSREAGATSGETEPFGHMVEARSLRMALNQMMADSPAISLHAPAEIKVSRDAGSAVVRVVGGPTLTCRLVIAAEGRHSTLRAQAGIPVTHRPYGQTGIVCAVAHEHPHGGVALEHFLPAGPFAQLPMHDTEDGRHISAIVWTERTAQAERLLRLDDAAFTHELSRRLGSHLGRISLVGRRWSYPLSAMLVHRYYDTRLALVGDAAHGIHPIAGQGLNLGFRDIDCLAGLIVEAVRAGADPGAPDLLRRYQAVRRPDNMLMLAATDALDRLFSNDFPPLRLARDLGIAAVHRIPPLKRLFMRQAMGISIS